jgi:carboxymethylenebutenolidase
METMHRDITIDVDGGQMDAYLAEPAEGDHLPGIIIVHDIFGVSDHTRDVANRYAAQGYIVLAPNLFWRIGSPTLSDRESFMRFRGQMDDSAFLRYLDAALEALRNEPTVSRARIGILGFCMGGYYAFLEACSNSTYAACVDFYGAPLTGETAPTRPRTTLDAAQDLRVPTLFLFGEEDGSIPAAHIQQLENVLNGVGTPYEVQLYPGAGHAFFNDANPQSYREDAARDAWPRTLDFLRRYLHG